MNYEKMSIADRHDLVKMCKCAKLFNEDQRKMVLTFGSGAEGQALRALALPLILAVDGAEHKIGRAPRGYMERELENWLATVAN